jgi:hypothetical protein
MTNLRAELERVRSGAKTAPAAEEWIDGILHQERPPVQTLKSPEELKAELEREFLTPPTRFSAEWLNRLQQWVCISRPQENVLADSFLCLKEMGYSSQLSRSLRSCAHPNSHCASLYAPRP